MLVLGIETTCDETGAALVERYDDGSGVILSNVVLSQIADHASFGGVVPEIAARAHVEVLDTVIATAMREAGCNFEVLDGVAAAAGPGLIGGVIVGLTTAKAIAIVHEKPLVAVNHLEAHALTARLTDAIPFPFCLFLASGGHTQIVAALGIGDYLRLGTTRDDAIGEAFDKTAKLLGLGYPGGPRVEEEAARGDRGRFDLPRPMIGRHDADFSLSGLKTAVRLEAEKIAPLSDADVADLCASFQLAIVEMVVDRLSEGLRMFRQQFGAPSALVAAGGVAANQAIRDAILDVALQNQVPLVVPPPNLCTDNAAMIAWAGAERLSYGLCDSLEVAPRARWPLSEVTKPTVAARRASPVGGSASPVAPRRSANPTAETPRPAFAQRTPSFAQRTVEVTQSQESAAAHGGAGRRETETAGLATTLELDTLLEGAVMAALEVPYEPEPDAPGKSELSVADAPASKLESASIESSNALPPNAAIPEISSIDSAIPPGTEAASPQAEHGDRGPLTASGEEEHLETTAHKGDDPAADRADIEHHEGARSEMDASPGEGEPESESAVTSPPSA